MSESFGKRVTAFLSKLLLIALAGSFVLWGIGDVFRVGGGENYVAKIGENVITQGEYRQELNLRLTSFRRMLGENYSNDMVKALGIPEQVLNEMVRRAALAQEASEMNIRVPEEELYKRVMEAEAFQGADGFDGEIFKMTLRNANISEEAYMEALQQDIATRLLTDPMDSDALITEELVKSLYEARNQQRRAKLHILRADAVSVSKPAKDDPLLQAYYQQNSARYQEPEYRQLKYIRFSHNALAESVDVSEEQLRSLYEEEKLAYQNPEKRQVKQLLYDDKESAIHALEMLQSGQSLSQVAQKVKPVNQEFSLGTLARGELIAEAQEDVFALAVGEYSNLIESSFGWHIFQVAKIEPATIPSYEELHDILLKSQQAAQLEDKIYDLSIELEDKAAAGESIEEIAAFYQQPVKSTDYFDAAGNKESGDGAAKLPPLEGLKETVFAQEFQPSLLRSEEGAYYFITLGDIHSPSLPEFAGVAETVLADWAAEQKAKKLREAVANLVTALEKEGAKALQTAQVKTMALSWVSSPEAENTKTDLTTAIHAELFQLEKPGDFTQPHEMSNGDYAIAELLEVKPADAPKDSDLEAIRNRLLRDYAQEVRQEYLTYLQTKYPVEVNRAALESTLQ